MVTVGLIVLAIFILTVFDDRPVIAIVLTGLLIFIGVLISRVNVLKKSIKDLEKNFEILKSRLTNLEPKEDVAVRDKPPATEQAAAFTKPVTAGVKPEIPNVEPVSDALRPEEPVRVKPTAASKPDAISKPDAVSRPDVVPKPKPAVAVEANRQPSPVKVQKTPEAPAPPNILNEILSTIWHWFIDGNTFVRVGVVILFMGMTFLIKYAIEQDLLPVELRLAAVGAVAIALLIWGWRQREIRETFSLIVQGGGVGLLYLTIFASFSLYHVIPSGLAFGLLALIVILSAMLAIFQDARSLALFATVGGFLAPVLTSSGSNNYIGLFSYYTILNIGIFAIVWFKSWRILNLLGFLFTFAISTTWGVLKYKQEFFATTEPFLVVFFLMYVAIGVLYARNRKDFYKDYVDSSLIFGTPLLAFGLQCAMVKDYEYGIAISAFSLAGFYIILANLLWKRYEQSLRLLVESLLSLGVIFATLAIPFAVDGTLTGATWAVEGAGIVWISIKQEQKYRRLFGVALIFAAGVILASELVLPLSEAQALFRQAYVNSAFIGSVIIAVGASAASWLLSRNYNGKLKLETTLSTLLLVYAVVCLYTGFEYQVFLYKLYAVHGIQLAMFASACALCFTIAAKRLSWDRAQWVSLLSVAPMAIAAVLCYAYQEQISEHYGYLVWSVSLLVYFFGLRQSLQRIPNKPLLLGHASAAVIIVCLLFWDGIWQLLLGYSLLAVAFNFIGDRWKWIQLKTLALGFLPVLLVCAVAAIQVDGNLIELSSIAANMKWQFPPGYVLWPFGFVVYFYLMRQNPRIGDYSTSIMHYAGAALVYGLLLWLGLWPLLLGASLLSALCCLLWRKYNWREMYFTSMALLPVMWLIVALILASDIAHPFYLSDYNLNIQVGRELGYLLWPLAVAGLFWIYKIYDNQRQSAPELLHSLAIILIVLLISWEASWHIQDYVNFNSAWHLAWLPLTALLAITQIFKSDSWPFNRHRDGYKRFAVPVLILVPLVWSLMQLFASADSTPIIWVPVFNPVDIVQAIIVMALLLWSDKISALSLGVVARQQVIYAVLAYIFLWMNVDLLRFVHHWANIPWRTPTILTADISQMALSLFWALSGLFITSYSSRKQKRLLWFFGAVLLGVVVLKLFLVDLSAQNTVERIVSFTGVGVLLMLVGYFSPLPPRKMDEQVTGQVVGQAAEPVAEKKEV